MKLLDGLLLNFDSCILVSLVLTTLALSPEGLMELLRDYRFEVSMGCSVETGPGCKWSPVWRADI